jgi:hypothetical protein
LAFAYFSSSLRLWHFVTAMLFKAIQGFRRARRTELFRRRSKIEGYSYTDRRFRNSGPKTFE